MLYIYTNIFFVKGIEIENTLTYYNENEIIYTNFLPNKDMQAKEEKLFLVKFIGKMAPKPSSINSFLQALSIQYFQPQ